MSTQVVLARCDRHEPTSRLEDDPALLCIDVNPTEATDSANQGIKNITNLRGLGHEVFIDRVVTTGVRHVAGDELLSARRALPERPLFLCGR